MPNGALVHPKTQKMRIGNWNVRTLYQGENLAIEARTLNQLNLDIMGISETHWTDQGKLRIASGETILYSGREDNINRAGLGLILFKHAEKALIDLTPISERLIKVRFFSKYVKLTILQMYAPTEAAEDKKKIISIHNYRV